MFYVFDSSFIIAIIVPDESASRVDKLRAGISEDAEILAPKLLWYEITNVFNNLIRRKRFTIDEVMQFYQPLAAIRLVLDHETGIDYSKKLLGLCYDYNLSSYDAAYLELAGRKNAVLCTLDEDLRDAAKKHGISLI